MTLSEWLIRQESRETRDYYRGSSCIPARRRSSRSHARGMFFSPVSELVHPHHLVDACGTGRVLHRDAIEHAEDAGVESDAERYGEDCYGGEPRILGAGCAR